MIELSDWVVEMVISQYSRHSEYSTYLDRRGIGQACYSLYGEHLRVAPPMLYVFWRNILLRVIFPKVPGINTPTLVALH